MSDEQSGQAQPVEIAWWSMGMDDVRLVVGRHAAFLTGAVKGQRADFKMIDLSGANLEGAVLAKVKGMRQSAA